MAFAMKYQKCHCCGRGRGGPSAYQRRFPINMGKPPSGLRSHVSGEQVNPTQGAGDVQQIELPPLDPLPAFHHGHDPAQIKLSQRPNAFWLFAKDMECWLGPKGIDNAHDEWKLLDSRRKQVYSSEATWMRVNRTLLFTPNGLRARMAVDNQNGGDSKAWDMVRSEWALGIGLDMTEIDHYNNIKEHGDDRI